jgi:DNA repair exonuclease SbcCD ATPase subunit
MIRFQSISYKNILSVGQAPLTLDLCSHRLTALYGPSGSGKSLFLDALSFVLFGRAFRDINKTDLINTINGKGLLVEISFSVGDEKYKIIRGLKPNIFEIILNGEALNQEAHIKDQQKYLEDQILKMNWKIFTHVVMLGAANYTPFMRLKPSERKKMVENILGIDVFSTMNGLIKTKISDETLQYKGSVDARDTLVRQQEYLIQQQKSLDAKRQEEIQTLTDKLIDLRNRKKDIDLSILKQEQQIEILTESFNPNVDVPEFTEVFDESFTEEFTETFDEVFEEIDSTQFDVSELVSEKATCIAEIKAATEKLHHIETHLKFYKEHSECPTCSQSIDDSFKNKAISDLRSEKNDLERSITVSNKRIDEIKVKAESIQKKKKAFNEAKERFTKRKSEYEARLLAFESRRRSFEDKLRKFEERRRAHDEAIKRTNILIQQKKDEFEKTIAVQKKAVDENKALITQIITEAKFIKISIEEKKNNPILDNTQEIQRLQVEIERVINAINVSAKKLKLLREAQTIIKDDGVKSEILKRYVPTLNRYINQYLEKMGMFVSFELDGDFNDTIKSRHRDILSYANYSEGERQRLDLAILMAWRHLAQAQSAVNTNLLVLDEVLDSYLDQTTTETILGLMKGDEFQSFNIVVISHKEGLSDSFDRMLHFQKKNNFTTASS